jgi:hypothetical protein
MEIYHGIRVSATASQDEFAAGECIICIQSLRNHSDKVLSIYNAKSCESITKTALEYLHSNGFNIVAQCEDGDDLIFMSTTFKIIDRSSLTNCEQG